MLVANLCTAVISYNLNRRFTWGKSGRSHVFKEVLPYFAMTFSGLALSTALAAVAHHVSDVHHLRHLARTVLVEGANLGAWGSLWFIKFTFFNRLFDKKSVPAPSELVEAA